MHNLLLLLFLSFEKDNTCSNNGDELNKNMAKSFIDDEAELSESDYSSENEENIPNFIDESDDEDGIRNLY